ncbi:glycosyltransferase [Vibrio splendidus]|uniref:glycosyltransferase n=1 Tax=Vibrio splendidus TaxID=29497 RepID=UPI00352FE8E3
MSNSQKIAVALCIYKNDKLDFVKLSIDSILSQESCDFDLLIQVDGLVEPSVYDYLQSIKDISNIFIFFNSNNMGLAYRLNQIIEYSISPKVYGFIARMDADDIAMPNRLKTQVDFLNENEDISVVGSDVMEISESGHNIFYKKMESNSELISKNIIRKCPLNHPSVMFRISIFCDSDLRYKPDLMNTQDYYLWVDIINRGFNISNINQPLLKFRVDNKFHSRRGLSKSINEFKSRMYAMNKLDCYTFSNILHTFLLLGLRLSPSFLKKFAYSKLR